MDTTTTAQPPPLNPKPLPQPPPSVAELRHISAALSQFLRDYDDLHSHIGFVNSAIDEKLSVHFEGIAVNFNDFALTPLVDSTNNNSVKNVLEGSVVERNPRGNVSECLFSDDDNVLEGVVSERKRNECVVDDDDKNILEGVVSERKGKKCVRSDVDDDVRMHASSDHRVVNDVLGDVNGTKSESECEQSDEGVKNYEKSDCDGVVNGVVEGVVITEGKCEEGVSESESESEQSDEDAMMYESTNYVKKREESDCDGVVNDVLEGVVVTEGKCEGSVSESECERSDEDMTMYVSDCDGVVNDVLEGVVVTEGKCEGSVSESECEQSDEDMTMYESDCDRVVNDVLEEKPKGDESDFKRRNEDVKNDEEIDASVKMEESDCAEIITDVPKAVVSDENSKGTVIECERNDDDVKMCESPNYSTSCEETDDEGEEIDATKNADDEGEKIDAAKNVEETDYDGAINELLEDIAVIEKNPIRTASKCDKVRTPQSSSSLENSEETDDEDGEIESSKEPEDADYDRFVTELLEDVVVPKPSRTASDSDQSYDKPQSPTSSKNHLDEIDVSMNPEDKNHEQTDVSEKHEEMDIPKNPAETDVSEKPEEMDIPRDPAETDVSEEHEETDISKNPAETDVSENPEEIDIAENPEETDVSQKPEETDVSEKPENVEILKNPKPAVSELERLCKSMSAREMKEYVVKHISDIDKLQKELVKALKLAINPAKLVLDSIGAYFLQSGQTYNRYLHDQTDEMASVLILECFVMISGDGIEISREDEAYAAEDANRWKNRMIKDGGLRNVYVADARGLLLLISGFGISDRHFSIGDIMELMRASNVKGISNILRRSIVLMPKIPEVIDMMVKNKLEVEAADIAYTFGLEYKCHPLTILRKFLRNVIDDIESGSPVQLEATKQQLDDLRSVKECLESHNIDPSKVLPEFKIDEEIHHLKKKLKLQSQVQDQKRKAMDIESLPNPNHQEAKRTCSSHKTMPRGISSYNQSMQPGYSYHDFNPNLSSNYVTTYSSSSLLNAPALPVNITNSVTSGLAGPSGNIRPYGWQDDCAELVEKYLPRQSQTYDSQPSSVGLYGRRPGLPVYMPGHPVGSHAGRYPGYPRYFPYDGFPARRGPVSDLYGFADVVENEGRGSRAVGSGTARY